MNYVLLENLNLQISDRRDKINNNLFPKFSSENFPTHDQNFQKKYLNSINFSNLSIKFLNFNKNYFQNFKLTTLPFIFLSFSYENISFEPAASLFNKFLKKYFGFEVVFVKEKVLKYSNE